MGNCANTPCGGCEGNQQTETTAEELEKYYQRSANQQLIIQKEATGVPVDSSSHLSNNDGSTYRRPIQIKSNQNSFQENKENQTFPTQLQSNCKSAGKTDIVPTEIAQILSASKSVRVSVQIQSYNDDNKAQEPLEVNEKELNNEFEVKPFVRINTIRNEIHPLVKKLLLSVSEFNYSTENNEQFDESKQQGPLLFANGAVYIGEIKDNQRCGRGKQIWKDGSLYEGYWKNDKAWGKGRLIHSDGDIYDGQWQSDRAHGRGIYVHSDGAKYEGDWFEDNQNGYGKEQWPDGTSYEGQYKEGKKNGIGHFKWADGSNYRGEFKANEIDGRGTYKWNDDREYEGEWLNNKMEGRGVFKWPDGRQYEGEYFNDKKEGFGIFRWPDRKIYCGFWQNGKQHGYGVIQFSDKQERDGFWVYGKYVATKTQEDPQTAGQVQQFKRILQQLQKMPDFPYSFKLHEKRLEKNNYS